MKADPSGSQDHKSAPNEDDQHCACQCHFTTLAVYQIPTPYRSILIASDAEPVAWSDNAPEAPCADIEHPPQLA